MPTVAVIPARLESSRLPRKVLADIAGHPMLWHVWSRCCQAFSTHRVYIATDSEEILRVARAWGARVLMTSSECRSGTERIASALDRIDAETIINVQGDEPMIHAPLLEELARVCAERDQVVTPVFRIRDLQTLEDPSMVKVVRAHDGRALYFSRAVIPHYRDQPRTKWVDQHAYFGHFGVYAYPRRVLSRFGRLAASELERIERLEQLRLLEAGIVIHTLETACRSVSVDTPADLERVRTLLRAE